MQFLDEEADRKFEAGIEQRHTVAESHGLSQTIVDTPCPHVLGITFALLPTNLLTLMKKLLLLLLLLLGAIIVAVRLQPVVSLALSSSSFSPFHASDSKLETSTTVSFGTIPQCPLESEDSNSSNIDDQCDLFYEGTVDIGEELGTCRARPEDLDRVSLYEECSYAHEDAILAKCYDDEDDERLNSSCCIMDRTMTSVGCSCAHAMCDALFEFTHSVPGIQSYEFIPVHPGRNTASTPTQFVKNHDLGLRSFFLLPLVRIIFLVRQSLIEYSHVTVRFDTRATVNQHTQPYIIYHILYLPSALCLLSIADWLLKKRCTVFMVIAVVLMSAMG